MPFVFRFTGEAREIRRLAYILIPFHEFSKKKPKNYPGIYEVGDPHLRNHGCCTAVRDKNRLQRLVREMAYSWHTCFW